VAFALISSLALASAFVLVSWFFFPLVFSLSWFFSIVFKSAIFALLSPLPSSCVFLFFFPDFICALGLPFPLLVPLLLSQIPFIPFGFVFRGFWFFFVGIGFASVLVSWFFSPLPRSLHVFMGLSLPCLLPFLSVSRFFLPSSLFSPLVSSPLSSSSPLLNFFSPPFFP
jgi:hypothetical protein